MDTRWRERADSIGFAKCDRVVGYDAMEGFERMALRSCTASDYVARRQGTAGTGVMHLADREVRKRACAAEY